MQLLPEPGDQEQPVVDAQAEAEDGGDVQGEHRNAGDQGQQPQRGERAQDSQRADRQRQARRGQASEDHQQQDQQDGEGQPFGAGDVGGGLLVDRFVGRDHPTDLCWQAGCAELGLDRVVAVLAGGVAGAGQLDNGIGLMTAGADELPGSGRPVAGVRLDLVGWQRGQGAGYRGPERRGCRGEGLAGVQHDHVPGVAAECLRGQVGFVLTLAVRGVEPAGGLHLGEDAGSPQDAEPRDEQSDHQDQPPAPINSAAPPGEYGRVLTHDVPFSQQQQCISR